jgi:hypothetical protein
MRCFRAEVEILSVKRWLMLMALPGGLVSGCETCPPPVIHIFPAALDGGFPDGGLSSAACGQICSGSPSAGAFWTCAPALDAGANAVLCTEPICPG